MRRARAAGPGVSTNQPSHNNPRTTRRDRCTVQPLRGSSTFETWFFRVFSDTGFCREVQQWVRHPRLSGRQAQKIRV